MILRSVMQNVFNRAIKIIFSIQTNEKHSLKEKSFLSSMKTSFNQKPFINWNVYDTASWSQQMGPKFRNKKKKKSVYFHTVNSCTQLHVLYLSAFALPGLPEVCLHTNHTLSKIYITEVINYTASVDIPIKKD